MWNAISGFLFRGVGTRQIAYITFPVAIVVGTIGYYIEKNFFKPKPPIPYLEKSLREQRTGRQIVEQSKPEFRVHDSLAKERARIVPNTLSVNTVRSSST